MAEDPKDAAGQTSVVFSALISGLHGSHAVDIGALFIAAYDTLRSAFDDNPDPIKTQVAYQAEAGLVVLGVGFLVLTLRDVVLAPRAPSATPERLAVAHDRVVTSTVVGLLGGFFSIIDKTSRQGVPTPETGNALYYLLVVVVIFMPPMWFVPRWHGYQAALLHLYFRICITALIAGVAGLLIQGVPGAILSVCGEGCPGFTVDGGHFRFGATSFWLSAPSVAFLTGALGLVAVDPLLRPGAWASFTRNRRTVWVVGLVVLTILLSFFYAVGPYESRNGGKEYFIQLGWAKIALFFVLIQTPGFLAAVGAALIRQPEPGRPIVRWADALVGLVAFAMGGTAAGAIGYSLIGFSGMTAAEAVVFGIGHGLAAAAVAISVLLVYRLGAAGPHATYTNRYSS